MNETGSVKFSYEHVPTDFVSFPGFEQLNDCREKLLRRQLIGVDANGIGFGNLSVRDGNTANFFITGSGTGNKARLKGTDYARVTAYDFARNWLRCEGDAIASSESLTHAAVYEAEPEAGAVIHCHDPELWNTLRGQVATTSEPVAYGTPEMALEVQRLFRETNAGRTKIFVMGGHPEGVVTFGQNLEEALSVLKAAQQAGRRSC